MEKEKVLKVEFDKIFDKWAWRITYQDEKILERGKFKDEGLSVCSYKGPYYSGYDNLFIRGEDCTRDNDVLICYNENEKELIEEKVNAINEKYGKPKRWRAEMYEDYYFINDKNEVFSIAELDDGLDNTLYELGNYFKTKKEAQLYADKIKKLLKERE